MGELVLRAAVRIACALPRRAASAVGSTLGLLWYHLLRFRRREVEGALARAFGDELGEPDLARLARANFIHYGRLAIELLRLRVVIRKGIEGHLELAGLEHLEAARAQGKGVLLLTGHLGNYDLAAVAMALSGYRIALVSKSLRSPGAHRVWMAERAASGVEILLHRNSMRQIVKVLRDNGLVGFVLDQHARADAVWVEFFGRPAATLRSLATLAARTGAPVVPVFARRLEDGTHVVEFLEQIPLQTEGDADSAVVRNTQRFTTVVEQAIRRTPEQWTWIHRRWKNAPEPSG